MPVVELPIVTVSNAPQLTNPFMGIEQLASNSTDVRLAQSRKVALSLSHEYFVPKYSTVEGIRIDVIEEPANARYPM